MRPSVLVVDDERSFRLLAEEALSSEGFDIAGQRTEVYVGTMLDFGNFALIHSQRFSHFGLRHLARLPHFLQRHRRQALSHPVRDLLLPLSRHGFHQILELSSWH